jgi:diguanylate cyclase (GGDEF)-like protein
MGGDEFVVLLEDLQTPEDARTVADKIRTAMRQPIDVDGRVLRIMASIGIALYPEHGREIEQLLKHADNAMYTDKRSRAPAPT